MHDVLGVRAGDCLGRLSHTVTGSLDAQLPVLQQGAGEIMTAQQLHDHERGAIVEHAHVVHAHDVIGDERGRGASLAQEAFARRRISSVARREKLERDVAPHELMAASIDRTHPARAYELGHHIAATYGAANEWIGQWLKLVTVKRANPGLRCES
jgi:hypothetical protein